MPWSVESYSLPRSTAEILTILVQRSCSPHASRNLWWVFSWRWRSVQLEVHLLREDTQVKTFHGGPSFACSFRLWEALHPHPLFQNLTNFQLSSFKRWLCGLPTKNSQNQKKTISLLGAGISITFAHCCAELLCWVPCSCKKYTFLSRIRVWEDYYTDWPRAQFDFFEIWTDEVC